MANNKRPNLSERLQSSNLPGAETLKGKRKAKDIKMMIRLDQVDYSKLKDLAAARGMGAATIVRELIKEYLSVSLHAPFGATRE
jgi:predicted DNA binding CopG/RHH family protein